MNTKPAIEDVVSQLFEELKYREEDKNSLRNTSIINDLFNDIETQPELKNRIKEAYQRGELVLVLGAGVSKSCEIPAWDQLINLLLARTFDKTSDSALDYTSIFNSIYKPNSLIAARYVKNWLANSEMFLSEVRELLYRKVKMSPLIYKLGELCANPKEKFKIDSVITYNYDNLLEKAIFEISNGKFRFNSVFASGNQEQKTGLNIYHPHGFLPSDGNITNENEIVLGDDTYHEQYQNKENWQNCIQTDKFKNKTCLFIGVSLTDPNMRRLLDIAQKENPNSNKHFIIKKRFDYDEALLKIMTFQTDKSKDTMQKIICFFDSNQPSNLKKQINLFEERDALSLGVKTYWVNGHEAIPYILDQITKIN